MHSNTMTPKLRRSIHRPFTLSALCVCTIFVLNCGIVVADIPNCAFNETVNLTNSTRFENGSYTYEGVLIPADLVGSYDYEELVKGKTEPVAPHMRGCVCKLKTCVKFCCHPTELRQESGECSHEWDEELPYSPFVNVTFADGSRRSVHVLNEFVVQQGIPCRDGYPVPPEENSTINHYELFENGTLRLFDIHFFSKSDYCLSPDKIDDEHILIPMLCPNYHEDPPNQIVNLIVMAISVPFLVLTALVYLCVPKLQNAHGRCLVCYLVSLAMATILFLVHTNVGLSDTLCNLIGFSDYYFFMAAFSWLNVISFHLWHNLCESTGNSRKNTVKRRLMFYSLWGWGFPLVLTTVTYMIQQSDLDEDWKPAIGSELYCWIDSDAWSALYYFYGIILPMMLFNLAMFIMTARRIFKVQNEMRRVASPEDSLRRLRVHKENFSLYLRLFIVMGVTWLLEVFSYLVGARNKWSKLFYIIDFLNAAQGIIIFILFVLKRKVYKMVKERILCRSTSESEANSTQSEISPEEMPLEDRIFGKS